MLWLRAVYTKYQEVEIKRKKAVFSNCETALISFIQIRLFSFQFVANFHQ